MIKLCWKKFTCLLCCFWTIAGCSALFGRDGYFRDRGDDYLHAYEIPPIKLVGGGRSPAISEMFVIPGVGNEYVDADKEFEVPKPEKSTVDTAIVKLQTLHERQWISISGSPGKVWPLVLKFFDDESLGLAMTDPANGYIETIWLQLKNQESGQDKYRIALEQGLQPAHTEIHVTQVSSLVAAHHGDMSDWPKYSDHPERAKWLTEKLANYLANQGDAGVSLLAQTISYKPKVQFVKIYQGEAFLAFGIDFDRVWASVGGALTTHPFAIEDINRSEGVFEISYDPEPLPDPAETPGFFSRLLGAEKRAQEKRLKNLHHYRIYITEGPDSEYHVYLRTRDNEKLPPEMLDKLLQLLRNQLV